MKKFLILFIVSLMVLSTNVFASTDSITFRDVKWGKSEPKVKKKIDKIEGDKFYYEEEDTTIDSWFRKWQYLRPEPIVENGGVTLNYKNVDVAGYKAYLELSFMYKIKDGFVSRNIKDTSFYKAEYTISDLEDMEGTYEDIKNKLTSLYGDPEDKSYYNDRDEKDSPKGSLWTAKDGSLIWASIYYDSVEEKYSDCMICYVAPNIDDKLDALNTQIQTETVDAEKAHREENASNVDGL